MNDINQKYDLINGPFQLCYGIWNERKKKFIKNDITTQGECCVKTCLPTLEECRKICSENNLDTDDYNLCMKICNVEIKNACENNCRLISDDFGFNNPIYKGTSEFGCGDGYYDKINKKCLKKNKDNIIRSCKNNCTDTPNMDCTHHCDHFYKELEKPSRNKFYPKKNKNINVLNKKQSKSSPKYLILYFIIIVVVVLLIFFLVNK
jgi:hypothetical protein